MIDIRGDEISVPATRETVTETLAWIDQTLALPMYESPTEVGAAVVETLRTVRKLLNGGMHPDTRAALTEKGDSRG